MTIKLKKINVNRSSISIFIAQYVYFIGFFIFHFGLPDSALYVSDVLLVLAVLLSLKGVFRTITHSRLTLWCCILVLMLVTGTLPLIMDGGNVLRWFWSIRNWGRFFTYFIVCFISVPKAELEKFYDFTLKLFHINTIIIFMQFLFMRNIISQDALNGLVGRETSSANIILILSATSIVCAKYFSKRAGLKETLYTIVEGLFVSIIAELKAAIFFIIFIFFFMMIVNSKLTKKQFLKLAGWIGAIIILGITALILVAKIYPRFANILTLHGIYEEISNPYGYGFSGKIDRLTAVKVINKDFFNEKGLFTKFFGLGIGNAEYSSFAFLRSSFYEQFGSTYGYLNFTVSMLYLETGYVGLALFVVSISWLLINPVKWLKDTKENSRTYLINVGIGEALVLLLFILYNNLQRTDMSLLLAVYAVAPWVTIRKTERIAEIRNDTDSGFTDRASYK